MAKGVCYMQGRKLGFLYVSGDGTARLTDAVIYAEVERPACYRDWQSTVMRHCEEGHGDPLVSAAEEIVDRYGGRLCLRSFDIDPISAGALISEAIETERSSAPLPG